MGVPEPVVNTVTCLHMHIIITMHFMLMCMHSPSNTLETPDNLVHVLHNHALIYWHCIRACVHTSPSKTLTTRKIPVHACTYNISSHSKTLTTSKISDNLLHVHNIIMHVCTRPSPSKILTTRKISDNLLHVYNIYNYVHYTLSFKNPDNKENSLQFGARIYTMQSALRPQML